MIVGIGGATPKFLGGPSAHPAAPPCLDHSPFDPKISGFPGLAAEQLYVNFGDFSRVGFFVISCEKNRQTNCGENRTHDTANGVGNQKDTSRKW